MKKNICLLNSILFFSLTTVFAQEIQKNIKVTTINKTELLNKIKGGWAGKVIGVVYGGPYEFKYNGTFIQDYVPIDWNDSIIYNKLLEDKGLFDDVYLNTTFIEVIEKYGLNVSVDSFASAIAKASYPLWFSNQVARYNYLKGIKPPLTGYWKNNPNSNSLDFQIEADFAGLISPGIQTAANDLCNKVGHIFNYGEGYYGGLYVASLYANAYKNSNVLNLVESTIKIIPVQSRFYKTINAVIELYKKNPQDWKFAWFEIQKKFSEDISTPEGVFSPFNIDASINSAYVTIGLLYGNKNFEKTIDIATRCGQDADCNPSTAGGILGTMLGFEKIPEKFRRAIKIINKKQLPFSIFNLDQLVNTSYKQALDNLNINGVDTQGISIKIPNKKQAKAAYEEGFENLKPTEKRKLNEHLTDEAKFVFTGNAFVLQGESSNMELNDNYVFKMKVFIDNVLVEEVKLPVAYQYRRHEICWNYDLKNEKHHIKLVLQNPNKKYDIKLTGLVVYKRF